MDPKEKPWYLSRTIIVNIATLVIAIIMVITQSDLMKDRPDLLAYLLITSNVLNVILRSATNKPVKLFNSKPPASK